MKNCIILFFFFISITQAQTKGCTDPLATNFDPKATENNGSCEYATTRIKAIFSKRLSDSIAETSGLVASNHILWTHNDDRSTLLYGLNTEGKIIKKTNLEKVTNIEWEEISQDSLYFYIGDIGNNISGNRKDLHILRIDKQSFANHKPVIDTIAFSYDNQSDFTPKKEVNTTDFDCEAFVVLQDNIYLFTKQWVSEKTNVYRLPKTPGTHIAQFQETLNVQGLVTGATILPQKKGIVLCGYSHYMQPFVYLLYDYKNNDFSSGNKRKIKVSLLFHQIEAITTEDGKHFYLTNEAVKKSLIDNPQKIHTIDLSPYLKN